MSEGFKKLQSVGAQKIHDDTHIALRYVQAILHESFEGMQRVQLMGFISILEREYSIDLQDLRQRAASYFDEQEVSILEEEPSYKKELLVSSKPKTKLYIAIGAVAFIAVALLLFFALQNSQQSSSTNQNDSTIARKEVKQDATVIVSSMEQNGTNETMTNTQKEEKKESFVLLPKSKIWVGIIELPSGKKRQTITSNPFELNASKEYLITLGHGYIDFNMSGEIQKFRDPKGLKFLYRDGELRQISAEEFKEYNKGRVW